jgi:hypothetical protein
MRQDRRLMKQSFGVNEWNLADIPTKISNVRLALIFHDFVGDFKYGFPSAWNLSGEMVKKNYRTWRFYRHRQFKLRSMFQKTEG